MMSADNGQYFSKTYVAARHKFLQAAHHSNLDVSVHAHPAAKGPLGENLFTDVARMGPLQAENLLIISSGLHGIEGYAGSAVQTQIVTKKLLSPLPKDMAVLFVHAINPYGFAHQRRVNEDNIDLNRNFVDWSAGTPVEHKLNASLQVILHPRRLNWPVLKILGFIARHGMKDSKDALTRGQYSSPQGLFYGGREDAWSSITWRKIIDAHSVNAKAITHIDLHTGLGPRGYGEIISQTNAGNAELIRAQAWWGDVKSTIEEESVSSYLSGDIRNSFNALAKDAAVTSVTLEFGTVKPLAALKALYADNALYALDQGAISQSKRERIKQQLREAFYPDDRQWREQVIARSNQVITQAINGLSR